MTEDGLLELLWRRAQSGDAEGVKAWALLRIAIALEEISDLRVPQQLDAIDAVAAAVRGDKSDDPE